MVDVNQPIVETQPGATTPSTAPAAPVANNQPTPAAVKTETTATEPGKPAEKGNGDTVSREVLIAERRKWQERMRKMQSGRAQTTPQPSSDPNENAAYVRSLEVKTAEYELKDGVRKLIKEDYPELDPRIKKAILLNPLGYLKSGTKTVQDGLIDIQDYLDEIAYDSESITPKTTPTPIQVAGGNTPTDTQPGATPKDIQEIMNKPITEWTKKEQQTMDEYRMSHT